MQLSAVRTIRDPRSALALALAVTLSGAILGTACSGGDDGQAAKSKTTAPTPVKTATAPAAEPAKAAPAESAAKSAAVETPPVSATPAATAAAVDEHAGHDHPAPAAATAEVTTAQPPAEVPRFSSAAAAANPGKETATLAKAEALAAKKLGSPMAEEVDPNSKAKLTYEFGSETKAFGKCMQGDVLTHTFQLMSSGEDALVIKQAKPTCGCTVAQIMVEENGKFEPYQFGKPIAPGKKIEIDATLHTQNKRGHAGSRINIFSNDPRGQTQLGLEAEVDPFFQVTPTAINFNQLSVKDTATDKIAIATTKGQRVTLTAVKDNMPKGLSVEVKPLDEPAM